MHTHEKKKEKKKKEEYTIADCFTRSFIKASSLILIDSYSQIYSNCLLLNGF